MKENMAAEENNLFNLSFLALQQIANFINSNVDRTVNQAEARMLKKINKMTAGNVPNDPEEPQRPQRRRNKLPAEFQTFNFSNIGIFSNVLIEPLATSSSGPSASSDLFNDDNERRESFHYYNSTNFDFFNSNYNKKSIHTNKTIKHFEKNIFF